MKSLWRLNKYFYKYRVRFLLGILFVTVSNLFAIFPAQVIRYAFDVVSETINTYKLFSGFDTSNALYELIATSLMFFGMVVLAMALLKGVFMFFMRQTIIIMSRLVEYDMKNELYDHYQQLNLAFFKRNSTGDLMARITEDVSRVRMYIGPAIMYTINLVVLFVLVISAMLAVNVKLTIFVLLPLPILSITIYIVSNLINKKSEAVQRQLSRLSTLAQETFSGIRVIKAYTRENSVLEDYKDASEGYRQRTLDLVRVNALFFPLMIVLIGISTLLTIYIGGLETIAGNISTGNIAEFVIYVNMLTWPVAAIGWVTSLIQRAAASQTRINEFLDTSPEIINPTQKALDLKGKIEFKNVSFVYPDSGTQALKDVSFEINPGKSLAIIGRTGSGKSTIAALITRLYDTTDGDVFIDGESIKHINLNEFRRQIGYVPQEVFLFSETIFGNVAFGVKDEEFERDLHVEVEEATKNAAIYDSIVDFPAKFDTRVGERGITLSGGQKQRISIARAIIRNPKILIFDDCLSAVDTETEEIILTNLKRIMKDKTSIIISHRVSSVKDADQIIVLDEGQIAEQGSHQQLIDKKGIYAELYNLQAMEQEGKKVS